ncbi:MAG: lytic murein transglycosylase [Epsilonproteobacteria bacterium]|nr:lytic murein transglycosylase [Campylobacterota bacterium]
MKKTLFSITFLALTLQAKSYTNCTFKNPHYTDICKKVVKQGVSYNYANRFLLNYFKTQKFDAISWKYLKPKYIKYHKTQEKKANNVLVSYLPKMVKNIQEHQEAYRYAEAKYGVNKEIIAAILLKETKLGKIQPTHDAFIVFNTIVTHLPDPKTSRERWLLKMAKSNMATIIRYCYKYRIAPQQCNLPSSYAGAVGIPQFMPNSFTYAESYKNGIPNLNDMDDAILSVAKFLHKKANFTMLIDWRLMPDIPAVESDWYNYAYEHENASLVHEKNKAGKKLACYTKNKPELEYFKAYIKKIMRYNNSSNYAIGVLRLAFDAHLALTKRY